MGSPTVLIITQDFDPTVDPVVHELSRRDAAVVRFDLSDFPEKLSFSVSDFHSADSALVTRDRRIALDDITSIWYRRPTTFAFSSEMVEAERRFAHYEASHGIGGILRSVACTWVNRPEADAVADLKPYQLHLARQCGLRTPRTLLTNIPEELERALREEPQLVYKVLTGGLVYDRYSFPIGVNTTPLRETDRANFDRVKHTLCLFQELVEKKYEVRLTVIGDTWFPVTIDSQRDPEKLFDWRGGSPHLPYGEPRKLPDHIVEATGRLLSRLDLTFAAIDFIVTPADDFVFLEVNPCGQFMWMEEELGLPMSRAFADLLMSPVPYKRSGPIQQVLH